MAGLLALSLGACAVSRPVGDFERARPSFTHDVAMPAVGQQLADMRGEPVSLFNLADEEREMHDRVWRFLIAPHAADWQFDAVVELQRTRIIPPSDTAFTTDRYYNWLRSTAYASSRTRYSSVGEHVTIDLQTLPETFAIICRVKEIDRQRAISYAALGGRLAPGTAANVSARKSENDAFIAWFVRSVSYRYGSYNYALDHLLVETPHEQSIAVDEALRRLAVFEGRARRGDFCGGAVVVGGGGDAHGIPSRYQHWAKEEVVFPK